MRYTFLYWLHRSCFHTNWLNSFHMTFSNYFCLFFVPHPCCLSRFSLLNLTCLTWEILNFSPNGSTSSQKVWISHKLELMVFELLRVQCTCCISLIIIWCIDKILVLCLLIKRTNFFPLCVYNECAYSNPVNSTLLGIYLHHIIRTVWN